MLAVGSKGLNISKQRYHGDTVQSIHSPVVGFCEVKIKDISCVFTFNVIIHTAVIDTNRF